jgi:hypothetical protein
MDGEVTINGHEINGNENGEYPERIIPPVLADALPDLVAIALSRLTNQFNESTKLRAMVEAMIAPLQIALEDSAALKSERWLDTAVGQQLDGLGYIVGESRQGRTDDEYRDAILFRVFVNTSNATPADMIQGLRTLTKPDDIQYIEQYPATAMLFTDGPNIPSNLQTVMQGLAPAAISDVPIMVSYSRPKPFRFSKTPNNGVLRVNTNSRLTANGFRISVTTAALQEDGPTFGGIAPSYMTVNGMRLRSIVVNDRNTQTVIESGYHLTGVYQ